MTELANGDATIETYTIMHDRKGPSFGILFGRLSDGSRFIANTPDDLDLMLEMTSNDYLGKEGKVKAQAFAEEALSILLWSILTLIICFQILMPYLMLCPCQDHSLDTIYHYL